MATLADDTGNWDVAVIVPEDGDLRDAASVSNGMTSQTRRGRWLRDVMMRENGSPGIFRLRFFSSIALLRGLTEHAHGDLCLVLGAAGGRVYYYNIVNSQDDDDEIIVKPTNIAADQPGRWVALERIRTGTNGRLLAPHGLSVGGEASFDADISAQASLTLGQILIVLGNSILQNVSAHDITASGSINAAGTLGCTGDFGCGGEAIFVGRAYCFGGLQVGNDASPKAAEITGLCTLKGGVAIKGASTLEAVMVASGSGRIRGRTRDMATDADQTIGASTTSVFRVPPGLLSAARVITLQAIGAGPGDVIEVVTEDATFAVSVTDSTGTGLTFLQRTSGLPFSARFIFVGTDWRILSYCRL